MADRGTAEHCSIMASSTVRELRRRWLDWRGTLAPLLRSPLRRVEVDGRSARDEHCKDRTWVHTRSAGMIGDCPYALLATTGVLQLHLRATR